MRPRQQRRWRRQYLKDHAKCAYDDGRCGSVKSTTTAELSAQFPALGTLEYSTSYLVASPARGIPRPYTTVAMLTPGAVSIPPSPSAEWRKISVPLPRHKPQIPSPSRLPNRSVMRLASCFRRPRLSLQWNRNSRMYTWLPQIWRSSSRVRNLIPTSLKPAKLTARRKTV
jgi:hypothetical protein